MCAVFANTTGCRIFSATNNRTPTVAELAEEHAKKLQEAEEAYRQGTKALARKDLLQANRHLTRAIQLNPYHGPAHNDLGVVHFLEGRLYEAALEFDAAGRQFPERYEPFYNLGMVLEKGAQFRKAAEAYENALKRAPEELSVMENLARMYVELGSNQAEAIKLLEGALLREQRPDWQRWIRLHLLKLRGEEDKATEEEPLPEISGTEGAPPRAGDECLIVPNDV
jgi:tetratricopeptide (TPR) repeat protein